MNNSSVIPAYEYATALEGPSKAKTNIMKPKYLQKFQRAPCIFSKMVILESVLV